VNKTTMIKLASHMDPPWPLLSVNNNSDIVGTLLDPPKSCPVFDMVTVINKDPDGDP